MHPIRLESLPHATYRSGGGLAQIRARGLKGEGVFSMKKQIKILGDWEMTTTCLRAMSLTFDD